MSGPSGGQPGAAGAVFVAEGSAPVPYAAAGASTYRHPRPEVPVLRDFRPTQHVRRRSAGRRVTPRLRRPAPVLVLASAALVVLVLSLVGAHLGR
ncbi:hypothetical protein ACIQ7D_17250 [Streptomyces sp. NPDC096310]|uniref:hypothetical protein n=1 Tax=Streptomyces sp. NPDC096310 TaxID=3366082 RepID=UPI0037FB9F4F